MPTASHFMTTSRDLRSLTHSAAASQTHVSAFLT
jgi:hypothetical protein